jgi:hypothetical protein
MFWFCSGGATCFGFAPEEQHVYSLTNPNTCALQRSAMCALARSVYMPLLTERDSLGIWSYKHVAPPEQTEHVAPPEQNQTCCSYGSKTKHGAPPEHFAVKTRVKTTSRAKPHIILKRRTPCQ